MMNDRRREQRLLFQCARTALTAAAQEQVRDLVAAPLDWRWIVAAADAHEVWPLLLTNLRAARADAPRTVVEQLDRRFAEMTALNLSLTSQLADVLHMLDMHAVRAVAFKGLPLAVTAYGHVGLRSFIDLDILVPRGALPRVRPVMLAHGYTLAGRGSRIFDRVFPRAWRDDVFHPAQPGLAQVEIHGALSVWALAVRLETEALLDRAITIAVAGVPIRTLSPEDALLMLALHGTFHTWAFLKHISDIDAASRATLDWTAVIERARAARMTRMLFVALLLSRDLLDTVVPPDVLDLARRDRRAVHVTTRIAERLFAPLSGRSAMAWKYRVRFHSRERVSDKLRYGLFTLLEEARRLDRRTRPTPTN